MQDIPTVVRHCQEGQLDAFATLFRHFQHRVYDLACVILQDSTAAEDVVQDSFLVVFQKIEGFRGDAKFDTWLTAIAVNQCRMHQRKQRLWRFLSLDELSPRRLFRLSGRDEPVAEIIDGRQRRQTLWGAVDQFPERLRLPMILRYQFGYSCDDIAKILDRRTSTIYQQLNEGRHLLEKTLQQRESHQLLLTND